MSLVDVRNRIPTYYQTKFTWTIKDGILKATPTCNLSYACKKAMRRVMGNPKGTSTDWWFELVLEPRNSPSKNVTEPASATCRVSLKDETPWTAGEQLAEQGGLGRSISDSSIHVPASESAFTRQQHQLTRLSTSARKCVEEHSE